MASQLDRPAWLLAQQALNLTQCIPVIALAHQHIFACLAETNLSEIDLHLGYLTGLEACRGNIEEPPVEIFDLPEEIQTAAAGQGPIEALFHLGRDESLAVSHSLHDQRQVTLGLGHTFAALSGDLDLLRKGKSEIDRIARFTARAIGHLTPHLGVELTGVAGFDQPAAEVEQENPRTWARKSVAARMVAMENSARVVDLALRAVGGVSYFKRLPLERYYRDVRAGLYHPFDSDETLEFLGKSAFGISLLDDDMIWA